MPAEVATSADMCTIRFPRKALWMCADVCVGVEVVGALSLKWQIFISNKIVLVEENSKLCVFHNS